MSKKRKAENEVTDPLVDYDVHKMHEFFPFFEQCSVTSAKGKQPVIEIILGYSDLLLREYLILHQHEIEEMKKPLLSLDWIKGFATSDQQHLVTRMYQRIETYFNFLHAIGTFNMEANPERFSRPTWSLKHDIDELYTSKKFDLTQQTDLEMMRLVTQRLTANFIDWQSGKSIYGLPPNQNHAVSRDVIDTLLASLEITHITGQSGGRMSIGYEKVCKFAIPLCD
jgi:hypothetical protein